MMPAAIKKLESTPMYDPHLLKELDWTQNTATFSPAISPEDPGEGLVLRPLCSADINRGFLKVLGQLTETGIVSTQQFLENFEHMRSSGDYYVTVVEDTKLGAIVATATLVIEHKFTHSCAKRGRIEDVVVSGDCRGKQLGKLLMSTLTLLSKRLNCYKITLECLPKNVAFIQSLDTQYLKKTICTKGSSIKEFPAVISFNQLLVEELVLLTSLFGKQIPCK